MAMQYQLNSEIQATDGHRTLYLMNPNFVGYSDDSAAHAHSFSLTTHAPLPSQPLAQDPRRLSEQIHAVPRSQYTHWGLVDNSNQPHSLSLNPPHDQEFQSTAGMVPLRNPTAAVESVIIGSKYVTAAQELLDEVTSVVGKEDMNPRRDKAKKALATKTEDGMPEVVSSSASLTTAQRQEILMKKAKLSSMLDEVDQRCMQYHQQMQIVVSSFEQLAGIGSARSYTQVALRTILRQFRFLKAAILGQIKGLNHSLGVDEEVQHGSRLRLVDHRLRQQRTLHQMGMMRSSCSTAAWRPQRGLPERAVAVLRAWLFEHFLHPYPKDSDKRMLAKQTGLTRSQVSNWFINARVRLWKPMVEEMYLEEIKTQKQQQQPTPGQGPHSRALNHLSAPPDRDPKTPTLPDNNQLHLPPTPAGPSSLESRQPHFVNLITSLDVLENLNTEIPSQDTASPFGMVSVGKSGTMAANPGFAAYPEIPELNRNQSMANGFPEMNDFSLSLGLPPLETSRGGQQLPGFMSARSFDLGTRMDTGGGRTMNQGGSVHAGIGSYEILDFQDRKNFQAQVVLPDFVA